MSQHFIFYIRLTLYIQFDNFTQLSSPLHTSCLLNFNLMFFFLMLQKQQSYTVHQVWGGSHVTMETFCKLKLFPRPQTTTSPVSRPWHIYITHTYTCQELSGARSVLVSYHIQVWGRHVIQTLNHQTNFLFLPFFFSAISIPWSKVPSHKHLWKEAPFPTWNHSVSKPSNAEHFASSTSIVYIKQPNKTCWRCMKLQLGMLHTAALSSLI